MGRPAKVYRGSNRRVNSIRLRGNMSREVWIFVALLLVLLFIAIPWLIRHPSAATRTIAGQLVDESCYTMDNSNIDSRWWAGEPFWVTAMRQGKRTASMFWPGSEVRGRGNRPIGGNLTPPCRRLP
jgi:hypothetical protein